MEVDKAKSRLVAYAAEGGGLGGGGCGSGGLLKCYAPGGIKRRLKALSVTDALSRGGGETRFSPPLPPQGSASPPQDFLRLAMSAVILASLGQPPDQR